MTDEELKTLLEELDRLGETMEGLVPGTAAENRAASAIRQLMKERDELQTTALAFVAAAAGPAAMAWGLKGNEILAHHFDLIAELGGRTDGFTRIEPPTHPPAPS